MLEIDQMANPGVLEESAAFSSERSVRSLVGLQLPLVK